ncbi:MAG: hypothetical protein L3J92_03780 [Thermoplasmata archaeon]|jgi:hypothetical protein|nr:hypothetical protein [Thermoplasmata archaeon]
MSALGVARSVVGIVLLLVGVVVLLFAALDLLAGFGVVYCLFLLVVGVVLVALSRSV